MEDVEEPEEIESGEPDGLAQRDVAGLAEENSHPELSPPYHFSHDIPLPDGEIGSEEDAESISTGEDDEPKKDAEVEGSEEDDPSTPRIAESLLERANLIFVKPLDYDASLQRQREQIIGCRVYIVHGDEHSGKLTCALYLAQYLLDLQGVEKRIHCYRRHSDESLSLLDFVQQKKTKGERAYIIEDAFPNVVRGDLAAPYLYSLTERLRDKNSFFILTTEDPLQALPAGVITIHAVVQDLQRVFLNHLDLYKTDKYSTEGIRIEKSLVELACKSWNELNATLKDPDQIDEFCRRLGTQVSTPEPEELKKVAQGIALRRIEAARPWFAGLLLHEKLFAFLVVLFQSRDGRSLYEIFLNVIGKLRDQGMSLIDPREIGYEDLLERVRALERPTRGISFQERAIGAEVEWQLKNYNVLLWSLVPWFLDEIERSSGREAGEIRRGWAAAVGRIGLHHPKQLRERLRELARHPTKAVAAATGYALSEVCLRDRDADQEVCDLLRAWVASRESRLLWTASSCIWRVYASLKRSSWNTLEPQSRLLDTLEALIAGLEGRQPFGEEDWKTAWTIASRNARDPLTIERQAQSIFRSWLKKNRDSVFFAIEQIVAMDSEAMIERLCLWLAGNRPALRPVSLVAIRRLFEEAAREAGSPRPWHVALVALVEPVLTHCGEGSKVTAALFNTLSRWVDQPVAAEAIAALLKAANRLDGRAARAFRAGLSPWLADPSPEVRRLGGGLLTRSLILEGLAVPALDWFRGALVLDASMEAIGDAGYEAVARRIWNLLHPRFDLRLVQMGDGRELASPGQLFPSRASLGRSSRPRLLLPALEAVGEENLCIVIVLATGPILDLQEASMKVWAGRLLLAVLSKENQEGSLLPRAIRIDLRSPESGLADLAARVDDSFATEIARASSGASLGEDLEPKLASWVQELDQPQSLQGPADRALAVLHAILESNLERSSALLTGWLSPDRSDLEQRMGFAAIRLLLRIEAHRSPPPPPIRERLFRLASALDSCGSEGLDVAFSAIRHWLTLEGWSGTLLDSEEGVPPALPGWMESLFPEYGEFLSRTLTDWRSPPLGDVVDVSGRLGKAAARIEEWLACRKGDPQEEPARSLEPETPSGFNASPVVVIRDGGLASKATDPAGFPMVWIEEIGAFIHWLPVTKIQFEKFMASTPDPRFDDAWYRQVLALNPRVAIPEIDPKNYWNAILTGLLPEEALRFAAWCGEGYSIPTLKEWQTAYAALVALPEDPGEFPDLLEGSGDLVRSALTRIEAASVAATRPGRQRTRADRMLMRLGVLEWIRQPGDAVPWAGMGEPLPSLRRIWSIEKGPVVAANSCSSRSSAFGCRLIRRPV